MSERRLQLVTYEDGSAGVDLADPARIARVQRYIVGVMLAIMLALFGVGMGTSLVTTGALIANPSMVEVWVLVAVVFSSILVAAGIPLAIGAVAGVSRGTTTAALRVDSRGVRLDEQLLEWGAIQAIDGDDVSLEIEHAKETVRLDLQLYRPEDVQRLRAFLRSTLASRAEIPEDPASSREQLRRLIGASMALQRAR